MNEERKQFLLGEAEKLRFLALGPTWVSRYGGENIEPGLKKENLAGHVLGNEIIADFLEKMEAEVTGEDSRIDWEKVRTMMRYHDIAETDGMGDKPITIKTPERKIAEKEEQKRIVDTKIPETVKEVIDEILAEYDAQKTVEARVGKFIDKFQPHIFVMDREYMEELLEHHSKQLIDNQEFQKKRYHDMINLLEELGINWLREFYEVVWEKNVELGIMGEDPQDFFDFRIENNDTE